MLFNSSRIQSAKLNNKNGSVTCRAVETIESIQLINTLGEVVFSDNVNSLNKTYTLSTQNFSKGVYTVSILLKNGYKTANKVAIQ